VTKDRPGYIRQHAAGSLVAELHVTSTDDRVTIELRAPTGKLDGPVRYTGYMERVSLKLEGSKALTTTELKTVVGGKAEFLTIALRALVEEGHVAQTRQGQTVWNSSITPFREADEPENHPDTEGSDDETF
jgi:hypothetical protein